MLCFYFYVFARSLGGMVARAGQRAKAKYLGFVGATAGKNRPGSRSTSLKTQWESSRAFLALLLLPPSLRPSLLSAVTHVGHVRSQHPRPQISGFRSFCTFATNVFYYSFSLPVTFWHNTKSYSQHKRKWVLLITVVISVSWPAGLGRWPLKRSFCFPLLPRACSWGNIVPLLINNLFGKGQCTWINILTNVNGPELAERATFFLW